MKTKTRKHVVIIGAGFAGIWASKMMKNKNIRVTLIDKNNYHTFLPLLYQAGAAEIEPEQIAYPVRTFLRRKKNFAFLKAQVDKIHYEEKYVLCSNQKISYDYLLVATGSRTNFFNVDGAFQNSFTLKSLDDAIVLRNHILSCFERAVYAEKEYRKRLLAFTIVGGGPTGVEFAGALAELINGPFKKDYPTLSLKEIQINLIESGDRILSIFKEKSSRFAEKKLRKKGVTIHTGKLVKKINPSSVTFSDQSVINTETVLWTAGVEGEIIGTSEPEAITGNSRIKVQPTLQIQNYPNVYVTGDLAYIESDSSLPMIAPVAIQQGKHAGRNIIAQIEGKKPEVFKYRDKGTMATIGRNAAVTRIGNVEFRGFIAWVLWLFIHIMYLIGFRNKIFVMINWVWDYIFFERSVRLILPGCCDSPGHDHCLSRQGRCDRC